MVIRKDIFWTFGVFLVVNLSSVSAQQSGKMARIGYLNIGSKEARPSESFLAGMRELGYVEGKNVIIEYRGDPQRREDRLPEMARELVNLKVDVIVALDPPAARAAQIATQTIPIVMRSTADPVSFWPCP